MTNQIDIKVISDVFTMLRSGQVAPEHVPLVNEVIKDCMLPACVSDAGLVSWDSGYIPLNSDYIRSGLNSARGRIVSVECLDVIGSTNDYLANKQAQQHGFSVCLAELQLQGKGRRGRSWVSGYGRNILMSVSFDAGCGEFGSDLSLQVGLYLSLAMASISGTPFGLKWPNDVYCGDKKIAGILLEARMKGVGVQYVVGVGININPPDDAEHLALHAGGLSEVMALPSLDRNEIAIYAIDAVIEAVNDYREKGFDFKRWNSLDIFNDRQVELEHAGDRTRGRGLGVDSTGNYQVQTEHGLIRVGSADTSLRLDR